MCLIARQFVRINEPWLKSQLCQLFSVKLLISRKNGKMLNAKLKISFVLLQELDPERQNESSNNDNEEKEKEVSLSTDN